MPARNRVKVYVKDSYYHVYNRGVAKQEIFRNTQDYEVFLKYLDDAFSENLERVVTFDLRGRSFQAVLRPIINFKEEIELIGYCLMPNHFHILLKQNSKNSMQGFMRSVMTRYAQYFNKKYDRVGPLFQGRYKAVLIDNDRYLLHLSRYIHLNPSEHTKNLTKTYSSYAEYLGVRKTEWIKPNIILNFFNKATFPEFKKINSYKSFVEGNSGDSGKILGDLILE